MRVLDLFSGGGGSAMGFVQAGYRVTGIDKKRSAKEYYPGTFICGNAMKVLSWRTITGERFVDQFDFVWASPPCQRYATPTQRWINQDPDKYEILYPELIPEIREIIHQIGKPYIIENVPGAPLEHPIELCGLMFGLKLYRHRIFECSFPVTQPPHIAHAGQQPYSVYGNPRSCPKRNEVYAELVKSWPEQMGIYHINVGSRFFAEAIPPAFSKYLIEQFLQVKK